MGRSATHKRALAASIPHVRYDQSVKVKRTTPVNSCSCRAWYSHGRSRGVATCRDNVSQHGSRPDRDVFCHDSSGHLETSCEACRHVTPRRELPATCIASCGSKTSRASYQHQRRHENTGMDRHHMTCGALCCRSIRCPERRTRLLLCCGVFYRSRAKKTKSGPFVALSPHVRAPSPASSTATAHRQTTTSSTAPGS